VFYAVSILPFSWGGRIIKNKKTGKNVSLFAKNTMEMAFFQGFFSTFAA
jgi:hypothetical protein